MTKLMHACIHVSYGEWVFSVCHLVSCRVCMCLCVSVCVLPLTALRLWASFGDKCPAFSREAVPSSSCISVLCGLGQASSG